MLGINEDDLPGLKDPVIKKEGHQKIELYQHPSPFEIAQMQTEHIAHCLNKKFELHFDYLDNLLRRRDL